MTRHMLLGLVLFGGIGAAQGTLEWRTDLDAARAAAKRSGQPLLIVFR